MEYVKSQAPRKITLFKLKENKDDWLPKEVYSHHMEIHLASYNGLDGDKWQGQILIWVSKEGMRHIIYSCNMETMQECLSSCVSYIRENYDEEEIDSPW